MVIHSLDKKAVQFKHLCERFLLAPVYEEKGEGKVVKIV